MINVARSYKWNFVMMSESLDGAAVTYRSSRHFEILNENIVFPLKSASNAQDYRNIFEGRRSAYGQAVVLANTTSHDEENYDDPWQALVRNAAVGMMDSASLIFPGQELGISRTFGFQQYEVNFGKTIPHFKRWNSMTPAWNDSDIGNDQLYPVYSGIQTARRESPALRSPNRWFLNGDGANTQIFAAGKYETANASPATSDVVLAFANVDRNNDQSDNFKIPAALATLLGLQDGRTYNAKNIAAYTAQDSTRRDNWLWGAGYSKTQLQDDGFFVSLNRVPTTADNPATPENEALQAWAGAPYEAQYLKVYDVTAPTTTPATPIIPNNHDYEIGTDATFDWADVPADAEGVVPYYEVTVIINSGEPNTFITQDSQFTVIAEVGNQVSISVRAVNPDAPENRGPTSSQSQAIKLLSASADEDGDGHSNADEKTAGTNPRDGDSFFEIITQTMESNGDVTITWDAIAGKTYTIQSSLTLASDSWINAASAQSTGSYTDTPAAGEDKKFYRVVVE
jgi:hypothetical protein